MTENTEHVSQASLDAMCWLMERDLLERMVEVEHLRQLDREVAALRAELAAHRGELADTQGVVDFLVDENQQRIEADYLALAATMGVETATPASGPTACHLTVVPTPAP